MSQSALNSKSTKAAPALEVNATVRELVAVMPIVIFANAIRAAFSRGERARVSLQTATR